MNIKQIKDTYTILDVIEQDCIVRHGSYGYLCRTPWRQDSHPSLGITPNGKGWVDQATGEHGGLVEFVAKVIGKTDLSSICAYFCSSSFTTPRYFAEVKEKDTVGTSFNWTEVVDLSSRGLYAYLHQRGIDINIAKQYVKEMHYSFKPDRSSYLYALAYRNDKGGYELRSAYYKGCTAPKCITTHQTIDNAPWVVMEGFIDMLSFVTLCGSAKHNYIVLNSTVNTDVAISRLTSVSPDTKIYLCLDNDKAGNDATAKMLAQLPGAIDIRARIAPCKDVNDYLCSTLN